MAGQESTILTIDGPQGLLINDANKRYVWEVPVDNEEDGNVSLYSDSSYGGRQTPPINQPTSRSILRITTNHVPKDPTLGFTFGSGDDCDILIASAAVNRQQFIIRILWSETSVVLKNRSQLGSHASFHMLHRRQLLKGQLFLGDEEIVEIILGDGSCLDIRRHGEPADWDAYCARNRPNVPVLEHPGLGTVPAATHASKRDPVYIQGRQLWTTGRTEVFKAADMYTGKVFAVKTYSMDNRAEDNEVDILKSLGCGPGSGQRHVVGFVASILSPNGVPQLIMEFVRGSSLQAHFHSGNNLAQFDSVRTREVLRQLLVGIHYTHRKGIIH